MASNWWVTRTAGVAFALAAGHASVHAGLFDDDEARKAIIDLRGRMATIEAQQQQRATDAAAAEAALAEQVSALRRSLLDVSAQLEALRAEQARQRGNDEQMARQLADVQSQTKDVNQALEERLRKLEPTRVSVDGREGLVEPEERRSFEEAVGSIRGGNFDLAATQLATFQRRFPSSAYTPSARFWHGTALYGKRDYKQAIGVFRGFVDGTPDHPRAPEALLALANSQAETKDVRGARRTLDELLKSYPQSEAAQAGRERLAALK